MASKHPIPCPKRQCDPTMKLGGRQPDISHTNLMLQPEQTGKITPTLGPQPGAAPILPGNAGAMKPLNPGSGGIITANPSQVREGRGGAGTGGGGGGEGTSPSSGSIGAWEPTWLFSRGQGGKCLDKGYTWRRIYYIYTPGAVHWVRVR